MSKRRALASLALLALLAAARARGQDFAASGGGAWDTALFQGRLSSAAVSVEISRRQVSGEWSAWQAVQLKRFPNGRFWGRARLPLGAGPLRLRVAGGPASSFEVYEVETYDSSAPEPQEPPGRATLEEAPPGAARAVRPPVFGRERWGAKPPREEREAHVPERATLHHTAGILTRTLEESLAEVRFIQDFHQNGRGWSDIGYHFLIDSEGRVFEGRPEETVGAHVAGHNRGNIGIALIGRYQPPNAAEVTPKQREALIALGRYLRDRYGVAAATWQGHRDYRPTTECPGDGAYSLLSLLRLEIDGDLEATVPTAAPSWDGR